MSEKLFMRGKPVYSEEELYELSGVYGDLLSGVKSLSVKSNLSLLREGLLKADIEFKNHITQFLLSDNGIVTTNKLDELKESYKKNWKVILVFGREYKGVEEFWDGLKIIDLKYFNGNPQLI